MSYQSGRMGNAEAIGLVFTLCFTTAFLTLPSEAIETSRELGWLSVAVSGLGTMAMLFMLIYVFERFPGDLVAAATRLLGRFAAYLVGAYYIVMFLSIAVLWIRQFAENTLITALPTLDFKVAIAWYTLGAVFIMYFGIEAVARACYVLLPFAVGGMLVVLALLAPQYKPNYLFPWQGAGLTAAIIKGGFFTGADAGALLVPVIAPAFQNSRVLRAAILFGLGGSVALKTIAVIVLIMVFGTTVAIERTLPFFELARLVHLSRYIQRIESIFIILWVMAGIFGIAISFYMGLYLITRLFGLPTMKPLIPVVAILLAQAAMIPPDFGTILAYENVAVRGYYLIGIYVIPLLLFAAALLKGRRRGRCASG